MWLCSLHRFSEAGWFLMTLMLLWAREKQRDWWVMGSNLCLQPWLGTAMGVQGGAGTESEDRLCLLWGPGLTACCSGDWPQALSNQSLLVSLGTIQFCSVASLF